MARSRIRGRAAGRASRKCASSRRPAIAFVRCRAARTRFMASIRECAVVAADIVDDASIAKAFAGVDAVFYTHPLRGPAPRDSALRPDRAIWLDRLGRAARMPV